MHSNPVQGQHTLTFRGRSRRNKEDVNEVLYQEDIEVSIHMYSPSPNDLQHTLAVVGWHTASGCANIVDGNHMYKRNLLYSYNWSV